jgi:hypothetical protein
MNSKQTKQLMLQCQIEMEQQRREEREDWLIAIVGSFAFIGLIFILAQLII